MLLSGPILELVRLVSYEAHFPYVFRVFHTALVNIVKDKLLLKDIVHLTKFVHTTALEIYHSLYLKYLPKLTHFSHDVMTAGTMLAALDHNFNANRTQVRKIM